MKTVYKNRALARQRRQEAFTIMAGDGAGRVCCGTRAAEILEPARASMRRSTYHGFTMIPPSCEMTAFGKGQCLDARPEGTGASPAACGDRGGWYQEYLHQVHRQQQPINVVRATIRLSELRTLEEVVLRGKTVEELLGQGLMNMKLHTDEIHHRLPNKQIATIEALGSERSAKPSFMRTPRHPRHDLPGQAHGRESRKFRTRGSKR